MTATINKEALLKTLNLSRQNNLSHLSSTLPCANIISYILQNDINSKIVLSNGHAALGMYAAYEVFGKTKSAEDLFLRHGVHPNRDLENHILCSTGSLGLGITIAAGLAVGNLDEEIHCVISDGECAEGSIWETLYFLDKNNVQNITLYFQLNGYGAYSGISLPGLTEKLDAFKIKKKYCYTDTEFTWDAKEVDWHYKKLDDTSYACLLTLINENKLQTNII
jgi:transketolase